MTLPTSASNARSRADLLEQQRQAFVALANSGDTHETEKRSTANLLKREMNAVRAAFAPPRQQTEALWNKAQRLETESRKLLKLESLEHIWPGPAIEIARVEHTEVGFRNCVDSAGGCVTELAEQLKRLKDLRFEKKRLASLEAKMAAELLAAAVAKEKAIAAEKRRLAGLEAERLRAEWWAKTKLRFKIAIACLLGILVLFFIFQALFQSSR